MVNAIIALIAISMAMLLGYWTQDRANPVELISVGPVHHTVPPGGVLKVKYTLQRKRRCHVHVEQTAHDSQMVRFTAPDEDYIAAPGPTGTETFTLTVPIPDTAEEGPAFYRANRAYLCNPLQYWFDWPIVVSTDRIPFEIKR